MKFAAVLAFAATVLAAPKPDGPPDTTGQCVGVQPGSEPGSWVFLDCPLFQIPPGSPCTTIPEDLSKPYPKCVSSMALHIYTLQFFFFFKNEKNVSKGRECVG